MSKKYGTIIAIANVVPCNFHAIYVFTLAQILHKNKVFSQNLCQLYGTKFANAKDMPLQKSCHLLYCFHV